MPTNTKIYNVERLTKEEYDAATRAVQEVREKNAKLAAVETAKSILDAGILMMIDLIGTEKTKHLLREKNRELRQ
jgi:hypothetical protein